MVGVSPRSHHCPIEEQRSGSDRRQSSSQKSNLENDQRPNLSPSLLNGGAASRHGDMEGGSKKSERVLA